MPVFNVAIEVRKMYHVDIEADDAASAESLANDLSSLAIAEEGSLKNVETCFIEINDVVDDDDEELPRIGLDAS